MDSLTDRLLQLALWQRQESVMNQSCSSEEIIETAERQSVLGLMLSAAYNNGMMRDRRGDVLRIISDIEMQHQRNNRCISKVFGALHGKGIHAVLLKGQGLATLYPEPTLRQCGDIDIWVPKVNYQQACETIVDMQDSDSIPNCTDKHLHTRVDGIEVEIHRYLLRLCNPHKNRLFQQLAMEHLQPECCSHIRIEGKSIPIPPPAFNMLYVFLHLWEHFDTEGLGLRQICDLAMVTNKVLEVQEMQKVRGWLNQLKVVRQWQLVCWITVNHLGLKKEGIPYYNNNRARKAERLFRLILHDGDFGKVSKTSLMPHPSVHRGLNLRHKLHNLHIYNRQFLKVFPYSGTDILWRYFYFLRHKLYWLGR